MQAPTINLTFHGIGFPPEPLDARARGFWVSKQRFEHILDEVQTRSDVRITFDDGNASDVEIALPALVERGLTATFFIVAGSLGQRRHLDSGDLKELLAARMAIGCHGMHHLPWRGLGDEELDRELVVARRLIERAITADIDEAACPYGAYDRRVLRRLRTAGYKRVFTSDGGLTDPNAWLQPRNTILANRGEEDVSVLAAMERNAGARRLKQVVKQWR